jgi:hypothetical protein
MHIVTDTITHETLRGMAEGLFGDLVKGVVDVERGALALDAELHADLEALLLEDGSRQGDLWGINLYPDLPEDDWIEFDSLINVRPSQGNRSRGVEDEAIQARIVHVVSQRIVR